MNTDRLCMGCMEPLGESSVCPHCRWNDAAPITIPLYLKPRTVLQEQYLVGRMLGHGGFGITYLGWDLHLERKLAIKEYLPSAMASRDSGNSKVIPNAGQLEKDFDWGLERFLDEARTLARFQNQPGIVAVSNFFRANGTAYLVMEYVEGITLDDYLKRKEGRIPFEKALRIMMPVMDALREVHKANIMHRDISPDNVYLCNSGPVKLLDFGAARYAISQHSRNLSIILKEGYAPEEQYRTKGNQGPWTDVYAVAATLYRAVAGKTPPPALDRLHHDELEPLSKLGVEISERAEAALLKALAVRAPDRFQSMEEFQDAIGMPAPSDAAPHTVAQRPSPLADTTASSSAPTSALTSAVTERFDPKPISQMPKRKSSLPKWIYGAGAAVVLLGMLLVALRIFNPAKPALPPSLGHEQQAPGSAQLSQPAAESSSDRPSSMPAAPKDIRAQPNTSPKSDPQVTPSIPPAAVPPPEPPPKLNETASAFEVAHDHGGQFASYCRGTLRITASTVEFAGREHSFKAAKDQVVEAKMNKGFGRFMGRILKGGGRTSGEDIRGGAGSFHIRVPQGNFNLISLGKDRRDDTARILGLLAQ